MQLDSQQTAAVQTQSRKAMVLAGAGAGKTRVLVERIAHLIENGASPYEVLAVTFTRKAAGEIRDRLVERIGNKAYHIEMGTMHALALRMVKRFGSEIGFRWQGVTVYGEWEEAFLLREIAKEMFIYDGKKWKVPKKVIDAAFARYYQTGIEPAQEDPARQLFDVFISRCKENNALSFGGLLVGLRLLIPKLAQYLKTKHVLVDEVQDIDTLQWDIINQMVEAFKASLFIVGDVDQCQPGDTQVLTSTGEYKALRDIDPKSDHLVTFDRHGCKVYGIKSPQNHMGYFSFRKAQRPFTGNLHTISAGGISTSCTPNHKWPVRYMKNETNQKLYCVYIMQQGDRFRIGQCLFFGRRTAGFGFAVRCRLEKADRAWILSVHESRQEALIQEEVMSYKYGIPQVCFEEHSPGYNRKIIDGIYSQLSHKTLYIAAKICLEDHGRNMGLPFWGKGSWTKAGWRTSQECYSCNIIEKICCVPKINGKSHQWIAVEENTRRYVSDFPVFSLDVDKHHTYIVNGGLVTCNSIYEWRGAVPEYLVQHQADFDLYRIETNYRSLPDIVTKANNLIQRNTDRIPKVMRPSKTNEMDMPGYCEGEAVSVWRDIKSEDLVEWFIGNEIENPQTAILSRVHGLLQKIDALMTEKEIPHTYIGKQTALTNSEAFRRFHAFLKLLVNPHDNFSFLLIKDLIGLPKEEYTAIRKAAAEQGQSHFQQWSFVNKEYDFFDVAEGYNFPDLIGRLLKSLTWPADMTPIVEFISDYVKSGPNPQWNEDCCIEGPIQHYLDWLATYDIQDEVKADNEGIILATIHAAKGLEWDTVIVAGMNEGILPSSQALKNGDLEAERRLAYVAMTRAKDQLILAVRPEVEEKDGRIHEAPVSRFINEIQ